MAQMQAVLVEVSDGEMRLCLTSEAFQQMFCKMVNFTKPRTSFKCSLRQSSGKSRKNLSSLQVLIV